AKELMRECCVPTADFEVFSDLAAARAFVKKKDGPIVVKADGLAAGKGVVVCKNAVEAVDAGDQCPDRKGFGAAGDRGGVGDSLEGEEASFLALTDGTTVIPLASSQDHKRIFDGDRGPNTGGMGAYSPAPIVTPAVAERVEREVLRPIVAGLERRGIRYR